MRLQATKPSPMSWAQIGLVAGIWTFLGLLEASDTVLRNSQRPWAIPWPQALALGLSLWYAWALVALVVFRLARRYPIDQRSCWSRVPLHLAAGLFFVVVKLAIDYPIIEAFYCPLPGLANFFTFMRYGFATQFQFYYLIYWALLLISHSLQYYSRYQERALRAAQLETRLARIQLHLLKQQLQPHFLFNTLNAISSLIHHDVDVADRMITRLGDLLRLTLDNAGCQEVSLRQELDYTRAYLDIEQARFGGRLQVEVQVDAALLQARVPSLLLQPLVENSIRHAIASNPGTGRIAIQGQRRGDQLQIRIWDDGPPLSTDPENFNEGIGLRNTRRRLQQLYNGDHVLDLDRTDRGGLLVTIQIPYAEMEELGEMEPAWSAGPTRFVE